MLRADRGPSGYWVEAGTARVRLDAGPGSVAAMARFGLPWQGVTHQVISHFHLDHVGDLPFLLFALKHGMEPRRSAPLGVLGPAGLAAHVDAVTRLHEVELERLGYPVEVVELAPGAARALAPGVTLRVARTPHTRESLAVRLDDAAGGSLGYTGDTSPSDELADFFRGVDVLVSECSFLDDPRATPHLTVDAVAALAARAGARHLVASHFYFDPERDAAASRLARGFSGRITLATDGLAVDCGGR
jgi:ribonuclease BN (tRNA processing enzyme)